MTGRLITFEGLEGSGKSSVVRACHAALVARGQTCCVTREPGGCALAEAIRTVLLQHAGAEWTLETELLLLVGARVAHIQTVIAPALAAGAWVLCDRFRDATYAYQGGGRAIPFARIAALEDWAGVSCVPDQTIFLDVPLAVSRARCAQRGVPADRLESEGDRFFERVAAAYRQRLQGQAHVLWVDATRPLPVVIAEVLCGLGM